MFTKRPLQRRRPAVALAPRVPPSKSRSVLVVSHHLDGFLRSASCGLVASRYRSWGSPRFRAPRPVEDRDGAALSRGAGPYPSKKSPPTAVPRHRVRCLLAVLSRSPPCLAESHCWFLVCRGGRTGSIGFEALLRRSGLVSVPRRCRRGGPASSWALFPFMVCFTSQEIPGSCCVVRCGCPRKESYSERELRSSHRSRRSEDRCSGGEDRGSDRSHCRFPIRSDPFEGSPRVLCTIRPLARYRVGGRRCRTRRTWG